MTLENQHREKLLIILEEQTERLGMISRDQSESLRDWNEVEKWLMTEKIIPAVKQALINNELDNW